MSYTKRLAERRRKKWLAQRTRGLGCDKCHRATVRTRNGVRCERCGESRSAMVIFHRRLRKRIVQTMRKSFNEPSYLHSLLSKYTFADDDYVVLPWGGQ